MPWERVGDLGVPRALVTSILLCLRSPRVFYSGLKQKGGAYHAWLFGMAVGSIGILSDALWTGPTNALLAPFDHLGISIPASTHSAAYLIGSPLLITLQIALVSLYCHALLAFSGGRAHPLKTTFVVVCYAQSAAVLSMIPFLGSMVGSVWGLVILLVGLAEKRGISRTRTLLTLLLPLFILIVIALLATAMAAGSGLLVSRLLKDMLPAFR